MYEPAFALGGVWRGSLSLSLLSNEDLQSFLGEGPPGSGFKVFKVTLKGRSLIPIRKGNGSLKAPRSIFGGMLYFASIMAADPILQIAGQAAVKAPDVRLALQNVNVRKVHF